MDFETITIRCAESKDIPGIWDLLHADCKPWREDEIKENLNQILLLSKQDKLLGVLFWEFNFGNKQVHWVVIHPFYPEEHFKELLIHSFHGYSRSFGKKENSKKTIQAIPCPGEL